MDVLSSQANLAGYRAVIEAAEAFGRAMLNPPVPGTAPFTPKVLGSGPP
jgi:NAD(P) transhydrogenase subunit alpha